MADTALAGADTLAVGAWIAAALLVPAGLAKLREPAASRAALRLAGLPSSAAVVRGLGGVEVGTAAAVLAVGGTVPALVLVVLYAAFAAFAWSQHRDPAASCGCFGVESAPLSRLHVAVDLLLVAVSAPAVVAGVAPLGRVATQLGVVAGGALVVLVATAAGLLRATLTTLPTLADRLATPRAAPAAPSRVRRVPPNVEGASS